MSRSTGMDQMRASFIGGVSIFSKADERVCLVLPIIPLFLAFAELICGWHISANQLIWMIFIAKFFFLSHVHLLFSYIMLFFFPEFKEWRKSRSHNSWLEWVLVFLSFWYLSEIVVPYLSSSSDTKLYGTALIIGFSFYAHHHLISQSIGLSLLYNRVLMKTGLVDAKGEQKILKTEAKERWLLLLSMGFSLGYRTILEYTKSSSLSFAAHLLPAISLGCVVYNFWLCYSTSWPYRSNKLIFLVRSFLIPLSAYSDFALMGYLIFHGTEALFVFRKACKSTALRRTGGTLMTIEVFLMSIVLIGFGFFNAPITTFVYRLLPQFDTYLNALVGISLATSKLHFYTSGQMYRMRDAKTREKIGPLLLSDTRDSQAA